MNLDDPKDCAVADAWDRLNQAIAEVSVAQPYRLWQAIDEMMAAREKLRLAIVRAFNHDRPEGENE